LSFSLEKRFVNYGFPRN